MTQSIKTQIQQYADRLKDAMLHSDVLELDELLAADLVFTNHHGYLMGKDDDIGAHQSRVLKIEKIDLSDQKIKNFAGHCRCHCSGPHSWYFCR